MTQELQTATAAGINCNWLQCRSAERSISLQPRRTFVRGICFIHKYSALPPTGNFESQLSSNHAMPPVKPSQRTHYKDEARSQVIPSDVADTMNEIRDGLNVIFDDSVRRVKGTADRQVDFQSFMHLAKKLT